MTDAENSPLTLYTIAMSHYSEKIRWVLDHEGWPYREVVLTPVFHIWPALRMGWRGQTTVPVLRMGKRCVQDSTRIVEQLSKLRPLRSLPSKDAERIMVVEDRFDAIGKDVARYLYQLGFAHTEEILNIWTLFSTPFEARVVRATYPAIKAAFRVKLNINEKAARLAETRIDETLRWLESHIADGRQFLVGDSFSVADITAASLLAPMACPLEHPIYGSATFRTSLAADVPLWRNRAGLQWVRDTYERHRGPIWKTSRRAA